MADSMTSRERMIAFFTDKPVDRVPFINQWGPWEEARLRWKREGMKSDDDWYTLFGFDSSGVDLGVNLGICPEYEWKQIDEDDEYIIFRDGHGVLQRARKDGTSMPEWLDYPVKDRKTWEEHKWRFDPETPERFPPDWGARAEQLKQSDELTLICPYPYGFLSGPRTMMGVEGSLYAMADDPELILDINETLCNLWMALLQRVYDEARLDVIHAWEDMAGKNGSLISPGMFHRFMTPFYRRMMTLAEERGTVIRLVDSDGYMHGLTPLFLEAGMTGIYPYEVQAANDVGKLLREYPSFHALGHIDKRAMAKDKAAMDVEIERLREIVEIGRFIPHMDHAVPPDVSWENYQYMVWRWKELVGKMG